MATVKNYIKPRGSTYHYERRYPVHITRLAHFDRGTKFQVSLGTTDLRVARTRAVEKDREFDQICKDALRGTTREVRPSAPTSSLLEATSLVSDSYLKKISDHYFREFVRKDIELERRAETDEWAADELEMKASRLAPSVHVDEHGRPVDEARAVGLHNEFLLQEFTSDSDYIVASLARELGIETGSPTYRNIQKAIANARLRAYHAGYEKKPGDMFPAGYSPDAQPVNLSVEREWTLTRLSEEYIKHSKLEPSWRDKVEKAVAVFEAYYGPSKSATSIDRKKVKSFTKFLLEAPARATQYFPGMSLADASEANTKRAKPYPKMDPNTVKNGYIGPLRKVFSYALSELDLSDNPFANTTVEGARRSAKKSIFDLDELNALFALPLFRGCQSSRYRLVPGNHHIDDESFWTPLMMLFTGARVSEIAQLAVTDIKLDATVPYMCVECHKAGAMTIKPDFTAYLIEAARGIRPQMWGRWFIPAWGVSRPSHRLKRPAPYMSACPTRARSLKPKLRRWDAISNPRPRCGYPCGLNADKLQTICRQNHANGAAIH